MSELALPDPKNENAVRVIGLIDKLLNPLPHDLERATWASAVISEVNNLDPRCSVRSVLSCAANLAYIGLIPGNALGHAHMVDFNVKQPNGRKEKQAQLIIGYKGYLELSYSNSFLTCVHPNLWCDGEEFDLWVDQDGQKVMHRPNPDRLPSRDNVLGAYCVYKTRLGGGGVVYVSRSEIALVDKNKGPWLTHYGPMCKKTAVLRAAKEWKLTSRMARAVHIDESAELDRPLDVPPGTDLVLPAKPMVRDAMLEAKWREWGIDQGQRERIAQLLCGVELSEADPVRIQEEIEAYGGIESVLDRID